MQNELSKKHTSILSPSERYDFPETTPEHLLGPGGQYLASISSSRADLKMRQGLAAAATAFAQAIIKTSVASRFWAWIQREWEDRMNLRKEGALDIAEEEVIAEIRELESEKKDNKGNKSKLDESIFQLNITKAKYYTALNELDSISEARCQYIANNLDELAKDPKKRNDHLKQFEVRFKQRHAKTQHRVDMFDTVLAAYKLALMGNLAEKFQDLRKTRLPSDYLGKLMIDYKVNSLTTKSLSPQMSKVLGVTVAPAPMKIEDKMTLEPNITKTFAQSYAPRLALLDQLNLFHATRQAIVEAEKNPAPAQSLNTGLYPDKGNHPVREAALLENEFAKQHTVEQQAVNGSYIFITAELTNDFFQTMRKGTLEQEQTLTQRETAVSKVLDEIEQEVESVNSELDKVLNPLNSLFKKLANTRRPGSKKDMDEDEEEEATDSIRMRPSPFSVA